MNQFLTVIKLLIIVAVPNAHMGYKEVSYTE